MYTRVVDIRDLQNILLGHIHAEKTHVPPAPYLFHFEFCIDKLRLISIKHFSGRAGGFTFPAISKVNSRVFGQMINSRPAGSTSRDLSDASLLRNYRPREKRLELVWMNRRAETKGACEKDYRLIGKICGDTTIPCAGGGRAS